MFPDLEFGGKLLSGFHRSGDRIRYGCLFKVLFNRILQAVEANATGLTSVDEADNL